MIASRSAAMGTRWLTGMMASRRASSGALRLTASSAWQSRKKAGSFSATPTVLTVTREGVPPGLTERARARAADLARHAQRGAVGAGDDHGLDQRAIARPQREADG